MSIFFLTKYFNDKLYDKGARIVDDICKKYTWENAADSWIKVFNNG